MPSALVNITYIPTHSVVFLQDPNHIEDQPMANPSKNSEIPAQHASKHIVEAGYDQIAPRYLEWATSHSYASSRLLYTQKLLILLPNPSKILELGCGAGVPCTQLLAQSHHVTGNDISAAQIELARKHVPNAEFVKEDMMSLEFEKGRFGAVAAFYSVIHLPREEQGVMLRRIWGWLEDEGYLLMNLGARDDPGSVDKDVRAFSHVYFLPTWCDRSLNTRSIRSSKRSRTNFECFSG
jgi:ubiquinone/menaquinone biosynthesis C-methylase UbiE